MYQCHAVVSKCRNFQVLHEKVEMVYTNCNSKVRKNPQSLCKCQGDCLKKSGFFNNVKYRDKCGYYWLIFSIRHTVFLTSVFALLSSHGKLKICTILVAFSSKKPSAIPSRFKRYTFP